MQMTIVGLLGALLELIHCTNLKRLQWEDGGASFVAGNVSSVLVYIMCGLTFSILSRGLHRIYQTKTIHRSRSSKGTKSKQKTTEGEEMDKEGKTEKRKSITASQMVNDRLAMTSVSPGGDEEGTSPAPRREKERSSSESKHSSLTRMRRKIPVTNGTILALASFLTVIVSLSVWLTLPHFRASSHRNIQVVFAFSSFYLIRKIWMLVKLLQRIQSKLLDKVNDSVKTYLSRVLITLQGIAGLLIGTFFYDVFSAVSQNGDDSPQAAASVFLSSIPDVLKAVLILLFAVYNLADEGTMFRNAEGGKKTKRKQQGANTAAVSEMMTQRKEEVAASSRSGKIVPLGAVPALKKVMSRASISLMSSEVKSIDRIYDNPVLNESLSAPPEYSKFQRWTFLAVVVSLQVPPPFPSSPSLR
jgi:hypothetical protein